MVGLGTFGHLNGCYSFTQFLAGDGTVRCDDDAGYDDMRLRQYVMDKEAVLFLRRKDDTTTKI